MFNFMLNRASRDVNSGVTCPPALLNLGRAASCRIACMIRVLRDLLRTGTVLSRRKPERQRMGGQGELSAVYPAVNMSSDPRAWLILRIMLLIELMEIISGR